MGNRLGVVALILALGVLLVASEASAVLVDVELQLLVDVSGSVDGPEFSLQRSGYVNAFRDADLVAQILDTSGGRLGATAVQLIYWSGVGEHKIAIDWMLIDNEMHATQFSNLVSIAARPVFSGKGQTGPGSAIEFGTPLFEDNGFEGDLKIMDVSGDGSQNDPKDDPAHTAAARDAALAAGVDTINGIVILNEEPEALGFYVDNVIGGANAFVIPAANFDAFDAAIRAKLSGEIGEDVPYGATAAPIPEPRSELLFLAGMLLVGFCLRSGLAE
ncbi:MAG: DUF1194 domain-containing protein [bacterium]|nr:DUF1194 domain-containing protein [bacterium]